MKTKPKVAIIGVGLLGGSIALRLKKKKEFSFFGWNHRRSSRKKAAKLLPMCERLEDAVCNADVVLLCSHPLTIAPILRKILPIIPMNSLVMDLSSVKGAILDDTRNLKGVIEHFVPCHPMAGKEKSGNIFADTDLYQDKVVFITPFPKAKKGLVRRASEFWKKLGAVPVVIDAKTHDRLTALTSHLPHLLAVETVALYSRHQSKMPGLKKAVGTGFKDATRIAAGNPEMWADIFQLNSREIGTLLSEYAKDLASLGRKLKSENRAFWLSFLARNKKARERIR